MEAATKERELSGEKAQRIVDAMRESVAKRGAAGSTFEQVAREAGRQPRPPPLLLRDQGAAPGRGRSGATPRSGSPASTRRSPGAQNVDDVLEALVSSLTDLIENEPAFFLLLYELFSAGRRNPDIQHEVGQLFERTRSHVAEVLDAEAGGGSDQPPLPRPGDRLLPLRARRRLRPPGAVRPRPATSIRPSRPAPPRRASSSASRARQGVTLLTVAPAPCGRLARQPMREVMIRLSGFLRRHRRCGGRGLGPSSSSSPSPSPPGRPNT